MTGHLFTRSFLSIKLIVILIPVWAFLHNWKTQISLHKIKGQVLILQIFANIDMTQTPLSALNSVKIHSGGSLNDK